MRPRIVYPRSVLLLYGIFKGYMRHFLIFTCILCLCTGISFYREADSSIPHWEHGDIFDRTVSILQISLPLFPKYIAVNAIGGSAFAIVVMLLNIRKINAYVRDDERRLVKKYGTRKIDQTKFSRPLLH